MPILFFLLLAISSAAYTQPIVLLDKALKEPLSVSTPAAETVDFHFFPIYQSDIDSVMKVTEWFIQALEESRTIPIINETKNAGASRFLANTGLFEKIPGFRLNLVTRCGQSGYCMELVGPKDGHKKRLQKLRAFLDYLRNNQFLVEAPR